MAADTGRLRAVLDGVPDDLRLAVEFRHESWFQDEVFELLAASDAALCLADRKSTPLGPIRRTASWGYLRMHEGTTHPWPCYGEDDLATWVERMRQLWPEPADVYVYFNNDPGACAPADAKRFMELAAQTGVSVARPTSGATPFARSGRR
jgi:uncharacterized protein YecE (DUF72 family)